tara:strand:- start:188 stop:811 length:624 start_codon:yes stop_codon:yes gene_type:complete
MDFTSTRIDNQLLKSIGTIKPKHFTTTAFIHHLIEEGFQKKLEDLHKMKNMQTYIHTLNNENLNLEKQDIEPKEITNKLVKEKVQKVIPEDLKPYTEKINSFWKVKKGSKSIEAWKQQIAEYRKFISKYNEKILIEQLDAGICSGKWSGITVVNYERINSNFSKKYTTSEPIQKHPNTKVFKASDHFKDLPKTLAELKAEAVKRGVA